MCATHRRCGTWRMSRHLRPAATRYARAPRRAAPGARRARDRGRRGRGVGDRAPRAGRARGGPDRLRRQARRPPREVLAMPAIEMAPEPYGGERDARRRAAGRVALEREGVTLTTVAELAELLQRAARGDDRARAALARSPSATARSVPTPSSRSRRHARGA